MNKNEQEIAPFVPTLLVIVRKMLQLAELKPREILYDIGSGDGRIPIMAAAEFNAYGVGIELKKSLITEAYERLRQAQKLMLVEKLPVEFIHDDVRNVDLSPADVVTMYLNAGGINKIIGKLEAELHEGTRVVSESFPIKQWIPKSKVWARYGDGRRNLYLYEVN